MRSLHTEDINPLSLSLFIVDFWVKKLNHLYSQNLSIFPFIIFPLEFCIFSILVNWHSDLLFVKLAIMN